MLKSKIVTFMQMHADCFRRDKKKRLANCLRMRRYVYMYIGGHHVDGYWV